MAGGTVDRTTDGEDRRRRGILAALLLVVGVGVLVWWFLTQMRPVPDVVGMSVAEAGQALEDAGFAMGEADRTLVQAGEEPGVVVAQAPGAGGRSLVGTRVGVTVAEAPVEEESAGAGSEGGPLFLDDSYLDLPEEGRDVTIVDAVPESPPARRGPGAPDVLGRPESDARGVLSAAGYAVSVVRAPSTTGVSKGHVFRQEPAPGDLAPRGTAVTISVSTGPPR